MDQPFHILLVEDSVTDAMIFERALRDSAIDARLTVLSEGQQVVEFLDHTLNPDRAAAPGLAPPDLVLLDLNLPGMDGLQVLSAIKTHPEWRVCPVVVLSTSRSEEEVRQTYHEGANTYIQKPGEYSGYLELMVLLHQYWSTAAARPRLS